MVVVNLDSGIYYSFKDTAADLWSLLEKNYSKDQVIKCFDSITPEQEKEINDFLTFVVEENLAEEADPTANSAQEKIAFKAVTFSKFEDMSDLIMLDPIHESDEKKGWPHEKGESESS